MRVLGLGAVRQKRGMDVVEVLSFLFRLSLLTIGKVWMVVADAFRRKGMGPWRGMAGGGLSVRPAWCLMDGLGWA